MLSCACLGVQTSMMIDPLLIGNRTSLLLFDGKHMVTSIIHCEARYQVCNPSSGYFGFYLALVSIGQVGEAEKELAGASATNPYARLVDESEGLDKIEELQTHTNEDIYDKVISIMQAFFDVEDGEVENLAPQVHPFSDHQALQAGTTENHLISSQSGEVFWHTLHRAQLGLHSCMLVLSDWQESVNGRLFIVPG